MLLYVTLKKFYKLITKMRQFGVICQYIFLKIFVTCDSTPIDHGIVALRVMQNIPSCGESGLGL